MKNTKSTKKNYAETPKITPNNRTALKNPSQLTYP